MYRVNLPQITREKQLANVTVFERTVGVFSSRTFVDDSDGTFSNEPALWIGSLKWTSEPALWSERVNYSEPLLFLVDFWCLAHPSLTWSLILARPQWLTGEKTWFPWEKSRFKEPALWIGSLEWTRAEDPALPSERQIPSLVWRRMAQISNSSVLFAGPLCPWVMFFSP